MREFMKDDLRKLNNLTLEFATMASLKIDELEMRANTIIPFCVLMLENVLKIFLESQKNHPEFLAEYPDNPIDEAMAHVLTMFNVTFGRDIQPGMIKIEDNGNKSKNEISKIVDDVIKKSTEEFKKKEKGEEDGKDKNLQ